MSDSEKIDKTITHYNAAKVLLAALLVIINVAFCGLLLYSTLLLVDCTTPRGDCAKRQAEQTQKVLQQIARHDEATAFCAARPQNDTLVKMRACVAKEMAK